MLKAVSEHSEWLGHADTLVAVVAGAFLATATGFAATQLEIVFARRRQGRDAALLFGEVFSTLEIILHHAAAAKARGDPYGPVTMRMLRAARRELDIYDRNREALCELREASLRAAVQSLMIRLSISLDGLLDPVAPDRESRDPGFEFLLTSAEEIEPLIGRLARISGHSLADFSREVGRAAAIRGRAEAEAASLPAEGGPPAPA